LLAMSTTPDKTESAARIHRYSSRWIPIIWAAGQVLVFAFR
jgi:hypothetical protein